MKRHSEKWFRSKGFQGLVIAILCLALSGCGPEWKRKFVRKRAETKPEPIIAYEPQEYRKESNEILYKRHFVFWKSWQEELVNKLGENSARDTDAFQEALKNLDDMKGCLKEETAAGLDPYSKKINDLYNTYKSDRIGIIQARQMRQDLDRIMLKIDKAFRYTKVKGHIKEGLK